MVKHKKVKQLSNKKKSKIKGDLKKDDAPKKIPTIEELLEAGETATASNEPDKALAIYLSAEDILKEQQSPPLDQYATVLEKLGEAKAALGDEEGAKQTFSSAIQLLVGSPQRDNPQYQETLAAFFLYLGQLSCEQEALQAIQKGLECLKKSVELRQQECASSANNDGSDGMEVDDGKENPMVAFQEARQKLASAQVTAAELYLTDLCFEENAESECEAYVTQAIQVVTPSDGEPLVDALQTAASLRLSQKRKEDAKALILRAYNKMQLGCEALSKLVGLADSSTTKSKRAVELTEVDAADQLPSCEFRSQTAKLLLECGADDENGEECNAAAIHVLGSLLAENDEVPEVWYLLGCAFHASKNVENAKYYWSRALEMLTDVQKQLEEESDNMDGDEEVAEEIDMQLQNIASQMEDVKSKLEDLEEDTKMEE